MRINQIKPSITGEYNPRRDLEDADCVIGQSFGASDDGPGKVNIALARYIVDNLDPDLPKILQIEIAEAMPDINEVDFIIEGEPSSAIGSELDSWQVLNATSEYMKEEGLNNPILVAQAYHVGRVSMQAATMGMDVIVPEGLPRQFDPDSNQFWTRSRSAWVARELPGLAILKLTGKL